MRQTMNAGDWGRLVGLAMLWGSSFLFYKILGVELPPMTIVLGRMAFGTLGLVAILRLRGVAVLVPRQQWGRFLVIGLLNTALPFTMFAWAETRITSGTAAILNGTMPMFTALMAGLVFRTESITVRKLAGVACGIVGVAVLVGPQALRGQDLLGQAACLVAALSYGIANPYAQRIRGLSPASMAVAQLTAGTLVILPLALIVERPWTLPSPSLGAWGAMVGIAVICTSLAYLVFFDLLARAGASNLSLVTLLVPVSALALGAAVLGETVSVAAICGLALIICGLAINDGRVLRLLAPRPKPRVEVIGPAPRARRRG
jgi:drug/metabolite transporter (DMT)-like permease